MKSSQPRPRAAQGSEEPAVSMPVVARRPWGLILLVLLIDIGLLVAGGWMLIDGLGGKSSAGRAVPRTGANPHAPSAPAGSQ
ncbi:MAG TPA: hypothetical protein VHN14_15660 [Kofleriaceae bacterium]|jgi:hypothetical protein|nr:hypothetical protein [Kofleriaceae bacterium]